MFQKFAKITKSRLAKRLLVQWDKNVTSELAMEWETKYCTNNYRPLEVVISRGEGCKVWDTDGKEYFDFLSAYSSVSQGHNHPALVEAMRAQSGELSIISRAFFNDKLGQFAKRMCEFFDYDKVCPMNSGAEAVEAGLKLARMWGYKEKGIPKGEALIVSMNGCFHGRTFGAIAMSNASAMKDGFYPMLPGMIRIDYNNIDQVKQVFEKLGENIAAIILEPIQGEAGIMVPDDGYLKKVEGLCEKHDILLICDEIQTGLARTGKMLCSDYDDVNPDILLLGKALSGGMYPLSCAIGKAKVMDLFTPGVHGSTYGGNPMACAVGMAALDILVDEDLAGNAYRLGKLFRSAMRELLTGDGIITCVRGRGLLNAVEFDHSHPKMKDRGLQAYDICKMMKKKGLLAKQTHGNIIRFAPPLVLTEEDLEECVRIISEVILEVEA